MTRTENIRASLIGNLGRGKNKTPMKNMGKAGMIAHANKIGQADIQNRYDYVPLRIRRLFSRRRKI